MSILWFNFEKGMLNIALALISDTSDFGIIGIISQSPRHFNCIKGVS